MTSCAVSERLFEVSEPENSSHDDPGAEVQAPSQACSAALPAESTHRAPPVTAASTHPVDQV